MVLLEEKVFVFSVFVYFNVELRRKLAIFDCIIRIRNKYVDLKLLLLNVLKEDFREFFY